MPVINWIGKDKVINHDKELPFKVLKPVKELSVGENSENLLIEGDNLEALKALMPFYYNKIKCIYIDPPYNTGNEKWIYNDKVNTPQIKTWLNKVVGSEGEDLCRHDKWLCMMYPRLKLLKDFLTDDGIIFISIDDNEIATLKLLCDEIFGIKNNIETLIWKKRATPPNDRIIGKNHEYILCYSKSENKKLNLMPRNEGLLKRYKNSDNDPRGLWAASDLSANGKGGRLVQSCIYPIENPFNKKEYMPPKDKCWLYNKEKVSKFIEEGRIGFRKTGSPFLKRYLSEVRQGQTIPTIWLDAGFSQDSAKEIKDIFNGQNSFENPKPVKLIKRIIQIATEKDSIVIDSFAGSGTTGQAVLELNKEDEGKRKFILVELEKNIAEKVTAKRLQKVAQGYVGAKYEDGTGQGFQYLALNGDLYDNTGFINPNASYENLAAYIYFTETKNYLDLGTIKNPYIGSQGSTNFFLFFEGKDNNTLDIKTIKKTSNYKGNKVIYADKCLIDEEDLAKENTVFKQIPYQLKKF